MRRDSAPIVSSKAAPKPFALAREGLWRRGELQRQVPRRVSEPRMVSFARRGEGSDRRMAATLQRGTSAFEPRLSHAERVRGSRNKASAPPCNGPGRYSIWGLRAPVRCSTDPVGTNAASKGGRPKLTVVRRTWAGQGWARRFFENWRASLKWQRLKPYEKFAEMIERHWDGIAAYCRLENKVSLGFVEGLNNKIRVIQRRAYGLRNEDYLRLKILTCMLPEL